MPVVDLATLTAPLSQEAPCGPDLDAEADIDFLNFMARAEGLLPASYFSGPNGLPFDRSTIDLSKEFATAAPFFDRTRDIRLLVLLAKFAILSRSAGDFVTCLQAIANLLVTHWDAVHPRAEDGEFLARTAVLETLDDTAPVILPLQYLPLVQSKRAGSIAYRHVMFASGEAQPREGEEAHDRSIIDNAFADAEIQTLIAQRDTIDAIRSALSIIEKTCGSDVKLPKIIALTTNIFQLLNNAVALRDPSAMLTSEAAAEPASTGQAAPAPVAQLHSKEDVTAALAAVEQYFCRSEPSNPALLLVRQAQQLIGKSFLETMQILVPSHVADAKFRLGKDQMVEIPVDALTSFATVASELFDTTDASDSNPRDGSASEAEGSVAGNRIGSGALASPLTASTRPEAFGLLEQVAIYYRIAEPSSPIALIADRAKEFADRDFLTLLRDLLPFSSE